MKKTNDRCPLQAECERKCQYVGHELDCVYYHTNGVGEDRTIPDQEEIRRERERKADDAWMAERMAEIADDEEEQETQGENNKMVYIPIEKLSPHPDNPRKDLGDLTELVDSIRENGIFQNLTVVKLYGEISKQWFGRYRIIIGHRRHAAAKIAGLKELPCVVVEMTPKEQMSTMLLENMQRSDLTAYEQAQGFQMMLDMGDTVADVAKSTGLSATTVRRRVKLTELDQKVLKEVASRQVSISDFDKLAQIDDVDARNEVLQTIGTDNFNMRLQQKVKAQRIQKNLPLFKETLKKSKAKKIQLNDTWNGKYDEIRGTSVDIDKFEGTEVMLPTTDEDLFYCLQEDIGRVRYFTKRKSAPPVKRSQAEIREMAVSVTDGDGLTWGEAWEQVVSAIRKYGAYDARAALDSMNPLTRRCVNHLGYYELCRSENATADRANFRMIFEQLSQRHKAEQQLAPALREAIETMRLGGLDTGLKRLE